MFAMEGKNGEIFWSSGDFPYVGATANPDNALKISGSPMANTLRAWERTAPAWRRSTRLIFGRPRTRA